MTLTIRWKMKPKTCCNSKCDNVFFVPDHLFFQKDLCDKCADKYSASIKNKNQ